jgi:hypothetical protein
MSGEETLGEPELASGQPDPSTSERRARITDAELEGLRQARFRERVQRVLVVMQREGVDFRGVPIITPEGRIAVRVVPVEATLGPGRGEGEAGEG